MVKNLKSLRQNLHISQQQLADIVGVSQQSINKYENHNIEPDIATLSAIADCFGVSVDYLIGRTKSDKEAAVFLTSKELSLINDLRKLSQSERDSIFLIIKNYLSEKNQ